MAFLQQTFGPIQFSTSATNLSVTTASQEMPGSYLYLYIQIPTMSVGYSAASTPIFIQGSSDNVNFFRFSNPENNTNAVGGNDFNVVSSVSGRWVLIPSFAFRYLKVEISGTVTNPTGITGAGFKFMCVSNQ